METEKSRSVNLIIKVFNAQHRLGSINHTGNSDSRKNDAVQWLFLTIWSKCAFLCGRKLNISIVTCETKMLVTYTNLKFTRNKIIRSDCILKTIKREDVSLCWRSVSPLHASIFCSKHVGTGLFPPCWWEISTWAASQIETKDLSLALTSLTCVLWCQVDTNTTWQCL